MEDHFFDHASLLNWFKHSKRTFPWRIFPTPYAVWVSEVMLQQTRASVVVPYFEKWMRLFPDIPSLAAADFPVVLKAWEGLGYYSRARNLHAGAKQVTEEWNGNLPSDREQLEKIKGLGPYTIGAILSFGFGQKAACVDGNVKRVLSRYFLLRDDISSSAGQKKVWRMADKILQGDVPASISEALIELGAVVCQKTPRCGVCPLKKSCRALQQGVQNELPRKTKKIAYEELTRTVLVISCDGKLLVRKCGPKEIMAGLYEFPFFEGENVLAAEKWMLEEWKLAVSLQKKGSLVKHSFTRFRVLLNPYYYLAQKSEGIPGFHWISNEEAAKLAFSSGHRRILQECISLPKQTALK